MEFQKKESLIGHDKSGELSTEERLEFLCRKFAFIALSTDYNEFEARLKFALMQLKHKGFTEFDDIIIGPDRRHLTDDEASKFIEETKDVSSWTPYTAHRYTETITIKKTETVDDLIRSFKSSLGEKEDAT